MLKTRDRDSRAEEKGMPKSAAAWEVSRTLKTGMFILASVFALLVSFCPVAALFAADAGSAIPRGEMGQSPPLEPYQPAPLPPLGKPAVPPPLSLPPAPPAPPVPENRAINPRTGEVYPRSGKGVFNPRTGEYYPPSGDGYVNPRTGEYYPPVK